MTEEILIDLKIPGAEDKIDALTVSINELNEAQKKLVDENKELEKSGQKNSQQYLDNARQIEVNKQKISENTASRKGLVQAMVAEEGSIKSLRIANADLIKQRDLISTKTDEGRAKIQQINSQIDSNNAKIKENSSVLEKQKINIGNYSSALDGIIPGFSGFIQGIQGATSAGVAFIATPIGAVLAAVAVAIGTLTAAIKTDDATADAFGKTWDQISSVFDVILRRVGFLGRALSELVQGNFQQAFTLAGKSVSGLSDEISRAIDLTGDLADRQNELDDDLNKFRARETARQNEANKLRIESRNKTLDEAAAIELINKASAIEAQLTKEKTELTKRQSDIDIEAIGLKHDMQRQLNETTEQYGLRLLENSEIGGEEAEKIAEALDKISQAQSASISFQEKLQNQRDALAEKELANQLKIYEQAKELSDKQFQEDIDRIKKLEEEKLAIKQEVTDLENENIKVEQEEKEEVYIKDWRAYYESEKQKTRIAKLEQLNRLATISGAISQVTALFKEGTLAYKALAIAQATMDTIRGATAALAPPPTGAGPLFGPILAASTIALGLANVAKIASVSAAAGGGNFVTKGPTLLMVGDNPGGVEHVSVTPISGKGTTRVVQGSGLTQVAMAGGGNLTAIGANETRIAASSAQNQFDPKQVASLMDMVKIVLVRESYEAAQMQQNERIALTKVV